jgi:hypothetical protein
MIHIHDQNWKLFENETRVIVKETPVPNLKNGVMAMWTLYIYRGNETTEIQVKFKFHF